MYFKLIPILSQLIINKLSHFVLFHHEYVSSHVLGTLLIKVMEICLTFTNLWVHRWKDLSRYFNLMYSLSRWYQLRSIKVMCVRRACKKIIHNVALSRNKQPFLTLIGFITVLANRILLAQPCYFGAETSGPWMAGSNTIISTLYAAVCCLMQ